MEARPPAFLYLDLDEFFVQVERLDAPSLGSRPLLIGGLPGRRGEVACASREARERGIRSGMPIREALLLCPEAVVLPCRPERIHDLSFRFLRLLLRWTPNVERRSVDEAWVDLHARVTDRSEGLAAARSIQEEIGSELRLAVSVGVGPTGSIAHRACQAAKPGGCLVWDHDAYRMWSRSASIEELWGVGPIIAKQLSMAGIRTVADLAHRTDEQVLRSILGRRGMTLAAVARGEDPRPLIPLHATPAPLRLTRTLSFPRPLGHAAHLARVLQALAEEMSRELRSEGGHAERIALALLLDDGRVERRSLRLTGASRSTGAMAAALHKMQREMACERNVRSLTIGITRTQASPPAQDELFSIDSGAWDGVNDRILERFGRKGLRRASMLPLPEGDR